MNTIRFQSRVFRVLVTIAIGYKIISLLIFIALGAMGMTVPGAPIGMHILSLFFGTTEAGIWIYASVQLKRILDRWVAGELFTDVEVDALRAIGFSVCFLTLWPQMSLQTISFQGELSSLVAGAVIYLLAGVWREASALREDVEATI